MPNGRRKVKQPRMIGVKMSPEAELRYIAAASRYGHTALAPFARMLLEAATRPHQAGVLHLFDPHSPDDVA